MAKWCQNCKSAYGKHQYYFIISENWLNRIWGMVNLREIAQTSTQGMIIS